MAQAGIPAKSSGLQISRSRPPDNLQDHFETANNYKCTVCHFTTDKSRLLARHMDTRHDKNKVLNCQQCDCKFINKHNLRRHVRSVHEKIKDFVCQICCFSTSRPETLKGHVKSIHLLIRDFKCDQCEYVSSNRSDLKNHLNSSHLKVFDHHCDKCDYKTAQRGHLNRHKSTVHKNMSQIQFDLTEHQEVHDLIHRKCQLCNFVAKTEDSLTGHLMSCHVMYDWRNKSWPNSEI